ncbi:MAG: iron ABC transporter permease [Pseudomonadota bacterium]
MKPPLSLSVTASVLFAVIVLAPVIYMVGAGIGLDGPGSTPGHSFLLDKRHASLAGNSLGVAGGTALLSLFIGVPVAFLAARTDAWWRSILAVIYVVPVLIPPYIHAITWSHMDKFLQEYPGLDIHSLGGVVFVLALAYFPFVTLLAYTGFKSIDRNLEEASLLYCGNWRTFRSVTLPLAAPHIFAGATFVFIFSIIDFSVPDILRVNVYPVEIFIQFSAFYDERAALFLSLPLIAVTLSLVLIQKWYMKNRSYVQISGEYSKGVIYGLGTGKPFAFAFCCLVMALAAVFPLVVLVGTAGPISNYVKVLTTSLDQIVYSLVLASLGATATVSLAFALSYLIRHSVKGKLFLEIGTLIPFAVPAVTMGIGLIKVWNRPVGDIVYGSSMIIVFGYVARFIPFAVAAISSGMKQLSPRLEEAAFLAVPGWKRIIGRIVVPLLMPSLLISFFIVFILAFGELGATLLVTPPGKEVIPVRIYNLMHYGADQMVAALCLIQLVIIFGLSCLCLVARNKLSARSSI